MSNYAIFCSLTEDMMKVFVPFINSINYFDHQFDVIVMHKYLSENTIKLIESKDWRFNLRFIPLEVNENDPRISNIRYCMANYRFRQMAELGLKYDACVLLDVDMILLSNIEDFLEASVGTNIFGVKNSSSRNFKVDGDVKDFDGNTQIEHEGMYWNNICAVPLFLNVREHGDILAKTTQLTRHTLKDDYTMLNVAIHQLKKSKYIIPMRNSLWIGTEMSWFKEMEYRLVIPDHFDTRFKKGHCIAVSDCLLVRSIHSKWWYNPKIADAVRYRVGKVFDERWKDLTGEGRRLGSPHLPYRELFIDRRLKYLDTIRDQFLSFCEGKLKASEIKRG